MNETNRNSNGKLLGIIAALAGVALLSVGMLAGSLFSRPAAAQAQADTTPRTITVAGTGEVRTQPDMANVNFQIHVPGATANEALLAYEAAANALTAKLKELGVAEADIILQPASAWPASPAPQPMPVDQPATTDSGYFADGTVTVVIKDLSKLRDITVEGLGSASGIGLSYIQYGLQNDDAARNDGTNKAIDDARSQADAVAAKLGLTVGTVSTIVVTPNYSGPLAYGGGKDMAQAGMAADPAANFAAFGTRPEIVVTVTVQVSYNFQ